MDNTAHVYKRFPRVTIRADVPYATLSDRDTKSGTTFNSARHEEENNPRPVFTYEHGESFPRNLPGHSQIIRILAEIFKNTVGNKTNTNGEQEGNMITSSVDWLSLYTADRPLQRKRTSKRKIARVPVCSFCREKGGKHKKWCVHLVEKQVEDPYSSLKRSKTDISEFFSRPRKVTPVVEEPATPYKQYPLRPPDYPDYSNLHRDVYENALSISRAKLAMRLAKKNKFELQRQLTDPFIFSYMNRYGTKSRPVVGDGMVHIFGKKNVDFTKHYEYSVKRIKDENTQKYTSSSGTL